MPKCLQCWKQFSVDYSEDFCRECREQKKLDAFINDAEDGP